MNFKKEPPVASPKKAPESSMYSPCSENKGSGLQRPRQQPSAPHTGCALWLLFAFCIVMFFISEFVFR